MIRDVVKYPDSILKTKTTSVTDKVNYKEVVNDLLDTADSLPCLGLAAPQIGSGLSIMCIRSFVENRSFDAYINPEIIDYSEETRVVKEGCMSFDNTLRVSVERPFAIVLKWQDTDLNEMMGSFDGIYARVMQHEIDHLNGIVITDYEPK